MPHRSIWHSVPILPFEDVAVSRAFYEQLGFESTYEEADYVMLRKDTVELHLSRSGCYGVQGPASCYFRTPDVDRLYALLSLDATCIESPPEDRPWRMREFHLRDPFGNILRFGQPVTE